MMAITFTDKEILGILGKQPVAFGLEAQGHLPRIEAMLAESPPRSWEEIGKAIGWDPDTACQHYIWHLQDERKRLEVYRETVQAGGCRCDPPGSGEEYCVGTCRLRAALKLAGGFIQRDVLPEALAEPSVPLGGMHINLRTMETEFFGPEDPRAVRMELEREVAKALSEGDLEAALQAAGGWEGEEEADAQDG
jgi:hypothetical protein